VVVILAGLGGLLAIAVGAVGVNAARERMRQCVCLDACWCKTRLGRHLRWWVPADHHLLPPLPHTGQPKPLEAT
jgi:hypothetical protein